MRSVVSSRFASALLVPAVVVLAGGGAGCAPPAGNTCGLSPTPPTADDVADGRGTATRDDGVAFDEAGTWAPAPSSSIAIGTLAMIIQFDETGSDVDDLIASGAFPICVPQGARSETSGQANLVDGGFVTDADHDGGVTLLGKDGDLLLGRFAFTLANPAGETVTFSDGVFRLPQRQ
jgi:hypothetical protein